MTIKLRTLVKHPSRIEGAAGIAVAAAAGGVVTVALDLASFSPTASVADQDATTVLLVTPGLGEADPDVVERIAVSDLIALASNFDAELAAIAGLASAADKLPYFTGVGTAALADLSAFGRALIDDASAAAALGTLGVSAFAQTLLDDASAAAALSTLGISTFAQTLLDDASAAAVRTTLGLVIGTDVQAQDAELAAIAALASAADKLPYFTGAGTAALADLSPFARSLIDDTDATAARATLGLVIGANVQAQDAELAAIAGLTSAADKAPYFTGAGTAALADLSSFGRSLIDDANAAAARTTLGVAIGADVQAFSARLSDIAGISFAQGDVLYHNGTSIVKLAKGASGTFLKSTATNPVWDAVPGGGDMLAANNLSDVANAATAFGNIKQAATTSATGVAELATKAEMEAATDTGRVPSVSTVQNHPGVAKGWAFVDTDGVLLAGYNITSSKTGTGTYTMTVGIDMANANYAIVASAQGGGVFASCQTPASGSFNIDCRNTSNVNVDSRFYVAIFGTQ